MSGNYNDTPIVQQPNAAIEAVNDPNDDSEFDLEEWDAKSISSYSLNSSLYAHENSNGRSFHRYHHGRYPMPNDQTEQNREDMKHAMLLELTDGELFYSPIGDKPQRILDIGTGTGIWAYGVADLFPSASVIGTDLSPMQPDAVPPNLKFYIDDAEDGEWLLGDSYDFIHLRSVAPVCRRLDRVLNKAYEHMKSDAWIEFQELHGQVHCDDGTMTEEDGLKRFYNLTVDAFAGLGMNFHHAQDLGRHLGAAGFKNIHCKVFKIPIGTWPKNDRMRSVGLFMASAVADAIPAFAGKPFEAHGISAHDSRAWQTLAMQELADNSKHRYFNFYFWYAQKP